MSKSVRYFISLLLVMQLIIPYSVFATAIGEFTSVVGKVTQTRAKEVTTPIVKSQVQLKDLIITEQASSAAMVFSDESSIVLSGNAKLEIKEFLFKDKSRTGIFSLAMGKLTAIVSKYIGGDNIFEVQSPTAIVGVRGTGFEFDEAINVENKNMATVSCTEGSLNLSALSPTGTVVSTAILYAGQMAVIIGGVITISAIGAAAGGGTTAATASSSGATATTTGATATTSSAGTAAAATTTTAATAGATATVATAATAATAGISTTTIVGVAAGVAAVGVTRTVAADSDGGDDDGSAVENSTPCNQQQVAGGNAPDSRNVELGKTSGAFNFSYDTFSIEDRIVIKCQSGGLTLYDTGCVGTDGTVSVPFSCPTTIINVSVTPNCANPNATGTSWDYTVYCP